MFRMIRRSSAVILLVAAVAGATMLVPRIGGPVDRVIDPLRFAIDHQSASGAVVVVEMDAASAAAIERWPWPRRNYAAAVDQLRRAGAASIIFDVDFSSRSTEQDDRLFAQALARANGIVVLPTFAQRAGDDDVRSLDMLPIRPLRGHVALASVSMAPDVDGLVRTMPLATVTADTPRPSLSAYIAARSGRADQQFPIDLSIDPASIPRLSFAAVRDGHFPAAAVRGKSVLIGATAIEMGDRYAVPRWGVLPGVVIQAMAAETLINGIPQRGSALVAWGAAILLGLAVLSRVGTVALIVTASGAAVSLVLAALVAQHAFAISYPLAGGMATIATVVLGCVVRHVARRFRAQRQADQQTALPNRTAFLAQTIANPVTVAVVQIHNLDTIAAVVGDDELKHVVIRTAERLKLASEDGEVYRVRGHHLAFVVARGQAVEDTMAGLRAVLRQPLEVGGRRIDVLASVGTATSDHADELLTGAALAADRAHAAGAFWMKNDTDRGRLERSLSLMGELDAAIALGHIEVHYQPKLALAPDRVTSVEALVRWRDPLRGLIGPDEFIPLAEQNGRVEALTVHVFGIVLRDLQTWRSRGHMVAAAVNISAALLSSEPFNAALDQLLRGSVVPADALIFEVTESAAMAEPDAAIAALVRYRDLGIAISMDDYGTGQSTLSYLQKLPLSELKIDRSFVQFAHVNAHDAVLVRSTIDLAHSLGLKVVAEGVEEDASLAFLRTMGCDLIQGYLISRPIPFAELMAFLDRDVAQAA